MEHTKQQNLDAAVAELRQRFGNRVVHTLQAAPVVEALATGFLALDKALGIGGIPRGCFTEFIGAPTSGLHTLAFKIIASAHRAGEMVVYLDLSRTFDPDYAVRCGVDIANVLLVRPTNRASALDMAVQFMGSAGVIVWDESLLPAELVSFTPLLHPLAMSGGILLRLAVSGVPQAALRLQVSRARWLHQRHDVSGYRSHVSIQKHKFGVPGAAVDLTIGFHGAVAGDGV